MSSSAKNRDKLQADSGRVRFALKWVTISLVSNHLIRFATTVVLARLLAKDMFGIVAIAHAVMSILSAIRETGFTQAYIQYRAEDAGQERLASHTTFFLTLFVNAVLFLIALLLSPWMARFFEKVEGLEAVLQVMFVGFLIDGVLTTPKIVMQKRLEFGKLSVCEILDTFSYAIIAISMALMGFGVWSLVGGVLGSRAIFAVLLFKFSGWRPRFCFEYNTARRLFNYGKYLWGSSALTAVGGVIDRLVVGRALGAASLGVYGLAFNLSVMPATQVANLVNRIAFPVLSKMQNDKEALRWAFTKALSHVSILTFPLSFGLLAVSESFVVTVYGAKWADMAPIVNVFVFYGMSLSVASVVGPALAAIGKPQAILYTTILHHVLLFSLLIPLARYGAVAVAYAVLLPTILSSVIAFVLVIHYMGFRPTELFEPLARSCSSSLIMYVGVKALQLRIESALPIALELLCSVGFGAVLYFVATLLLNRGTLIEFTRTVRGVIVSKGALS